MTDYWSPKNFSESTWSPFQSPKVREICAHLTPDEHARLLKNAQRNGKMAVWIAAPSVVPFLAIINLYRGFGSWRLNLAFLALYAVYVAVFCLPRLKAARRRTREFLCETEWARSQGYTPERLRLMKFPWQK